MPEPTTRNETVNVSDGSFESLVTLPRSGSGPGVMLLQEIFGVNDFIREKSAELAQLGYVVLAPDVFWRVQPGVDLPQDEAGLQEAFALMGRYSAEVDLETKVSDLVAALVHLKGLPEATGRRTVVLGYCLGGWLAYMTAAYGEPDACVSYYGSGIADCLELAERITCPALFHYGGNDPFISSEQIDKVAAAFSSRDDVTIRIEPEAGHAFENLLAPQFADPGAASRSWPATTEWLRLHVD
jgi:carboxymethylenebutenolidase